MCPLVTLTKAVLPPDVCTAVEDTRPVMGRNTDDQDGTYAEGTAKQPTEENRPQGKPSVKKSQSSKGKDIILSTFYLKNNFLAPSLTG